LVYLRQQWPSWE